MFRPFSGMQKTGVVSKKPRRRKVVTRRTYTNPSKPVAQKPTLTDQQLAQQYVDAAMAPYLAQYTAAAAREQERAAREQAAYRAMSVDLARELGGIPNLVQGDWDRARQATLGAGEVLAKSLAAANPNVQNQADLGAIGAPAEQAARLAQENLARFQGGSAVLLGAEGTIPAAAIASEGASQVAYARQLPAIQALASQRDFRGLLSTQATRAKEIEDARVTAMAQIPKLMLDYQSQLQENRFKQQEARDRQAALAFEQNLLVQRLGLDVSKAKQKFAVDKAKMKLQLTKTQYDQWYKKQQLKLKALGLEMNAAKLRWKQITDNRSWRATMRRLDISAGNLEQRAIANQIRWDLGKMGKTGGFTRAEMMRLQRDAAKIADQAWNGVRTGNYTPEGDPEYEWMSYQEAMKKGLAAHIPLSVMQFALNKYWTKPGGRGQRDGIADPPGQGRPYVPYQARKSKPAPSKRQPRRRR